MLRPSSSACSLLLLCIAAVFTTGRGHAQSPTVILPYTIGTVAGGGAATTAGNACATGSPYTATDAFGDGCPALLGIFSSDIRGGVATDPLGNVYIADTSNSQVRRVDPRSGLITTFAGGHTACSGAVDKGGDGCPAAMNTLLNSPRGIGSDPYGNIFIAGYSDNLVHIVCNALSPLCSAAQVGTMRIAAGCSTTTAAYGSSGNSGDGLTAAGACGGTVATVNQPRGVSADRFGNIYIGDTGNSRFRVVVGPVTAVTNPLIAILQLNPANAGLTAASAAGKIYAIVGGAQFTVPSTGGACGSGVALDSYGDGCPFYNTSISTVGGFVQGVTTDPFGNMIFTDSQSVGRLRVVYAGGTGNPLAHLITVANPTITTPLAGYAYVVAGGGAVAPGTSPILASTASLDGNLYRVNRDTAGNLYLGDNTSILFLDGNTGYLRKIAANNTVCTGANAAGDGCPATQASFGGSSNVLGLAFDNLGNLFFADGTNHTVRRISATSFAPVGVGATSTPSLFVHAPAGATALTAAISANSDFTLGAQTCTLNTPGDASYDCIIPVTIAPTRPGFRDAPITLTPTGAGTILSAALTASTAGAALTFDPATPAAPVTQTVGSIHPTRVAVDGHGNAYTVDPTNQIQQLTGSTATSISTPLTALPSQIAVDTAGNLYAATAGSGNITKLTFSAPSTFTAGTLTNAGLTSASAIAVDANGTVYAADNTTGAVLRISQSAGLTTTLTATALTNPVALALDNLGNLLIADQGAGKVYRLPTTGIASGLPPVVAVSGTITPVSIAADTAGNVYIADSTSGSVLLVPTTGPQTTVATGFTALNGIAVDGAGNVLVANTGSTGLTTLERSQFTFSFGSSVSLNLNGTVTNSGNTAALGFAQTDSIDFQLTGSGSTCNPAATSIARGTACMLVASFSPAAAGGGAVSDAISFLPAASSIGVATLTATKAGNLTTTTTAIYGQTPASPLFVTGGASVSFTVAVTASSGTAGGNLNVALDGAAATAYTLGAAGSVTVALSGLAAGSHSLAASYPSQAGISGSTATPVIFTVAQAVTSITWLPATLTEPFSKAIGTTVFNATANGVPGAFVYTATPTGGTPLAADASTYLPIGTYALGVTFTPADATDYQPATATIPTFTVIKAPTTAAVGASQNVVGTGANFATITAAVAALPATGGTIYIAPGTYTEQFTISYPNVALRGLGGNPQNVLLTAEHGAFSNPLPSGVTPGNNGAQGDQGSATVVVDKSTINGTTFTPSGFYAENLTISNTYDTDAANTNTLAVISGNCATGQPAASNFALFNAGTLCASQALALWTRSDKSVLNNVRLTSLQDTLYAGSQGCGATCIAARQYFFKGYIAGDVDYIFGDAAVVFDHTTFFTAFHGATATGTETIEAQNKAHQTGTPGDYLSGYILNSANLTSQAPGMTNLYLGRPYGQFSTFVMLNTTVDQVNPTGWIEFSGDSNLPSSTYAEFNTQGPGGTTASLAGREAISLRPELLTAALAAQYAPLTFLGTPAPDTWNAADALTTQINAFVPSGTGLNMLAGQSVTLLARPQTPGGGAIPTGAYTIFDGPAVLASGTLDASGAAYLTTSTLTPGAHGLTFTYGGDAKFSASSSTTPYVLTVGGTISTVNVTTVNPTYGAPLSVAVTVAQNAPTTAPSGTVTLRVDSGVPLSATVTSAAASFTLTGVSAGTHTLTAIYSGDASNGPSTATTTVTLAPAPLTVAAPTLAISFGASPPALVPIYSGFVNGDTAATALTGAASLTTFPAVPTAVGTYPIVAAVGTLTAPNYTLTFVNGLLTIGRAASTTALGASLSAASQNQPLTLIAAVSSPAAGTPTGSVSFYSGTTLLNTITLTSTGTAVFNTSFAATGTPVLTAVYSGDQSYASSTSAALSEPIAASGFTLTANPATLSVVAGTVGTVTLTLTPSGNYAATATFACSGLPASTLCSFATPVVGLGAGATVTNQLTFTTGGDTVAALHPGAAHIRPTFAAIFLLPAALLLGLAGRRRLAGLLSLLLLASTLLTLAGCGTATNALALAGSSVVTVTATAVNASGTTTQQATINLTITP